MNRRFKTLAGIYVCMTLVYGGGSCKQAPEKSSIVSQRTLDSIPSGSGIHVRDGIAYIVGDDATNIYQIDLASQHETRIPIRGLDSSLYREPKPVKHDFESATAINRDGQSYLLAIGSGSKANLRDSAMLLNLSDNADCSIFSLKKLYDHIRSETSISVEQWNIEGATVAGEKLVLANRGTNSLISLELDKFLNWLQTPNDSFPSIAVHHLKLPAIKNREARLSGLCTKSNNEILFCASVEDTPNWVSDGPILGSFIGLYSLTKKSVVSAHLFRDSSGKALPEKIESLDILSVGSNGVIEVIAIADNDNGSSKIFRLRISP